MTRQGAFTRIVFCLIAVSLTFATGAFSEVAGKKKFRKTQARPIDLGTSGGNNEDQNEFFCCSGTLGALLQDIGARSGDPQYILSNNHVIGMSNAARRGDPIGQPGLIEVNCDDSRADPVAFLTKLAKFKFGGVKKNKVDAAIAEVVPGAVDPTGEILSIGVPGSDPVAPALGMEVKKSGRTTGLTKGTVTGVDFEINVSVDPECGGTNVKPVRFIDQVIVESNSRKPVVLGGDSGSLVVENVGSCPAPVGLLFAGDSTGQLMGMNDARNVLKKFKKEFVGCGRRAATTSAYRKLSMEDPRLLAAKSIKDQYVDELFKIPGVEGAGLGLVNGDPNELAILVFVQKGSAGIIPARLGNLPVVIRETTGFKMM